MNNYIITIKNWFLKSSKLTFNWFRENKKIFNIWFYVILGTIFAVSFSLFLMAGIGFKIDIPADAQSLLETTDQYPSNGCPSFNGVWFMDDYIGQTVEIGEGDDKQVKDVLLLTRHLREWPDLTTNFNGSGFNFFVDRANQAYLLYNMYNALLPIWITPVGIVAAWLIILALSKYFISPWVKKNLAKINNSDNINNENH